MSLSDRIVVMRNAVVEQVGTPDEIYRRPSSVFVADFIGRSNFLEVESVTKSKAGKAKVVVSGKKMEVAAQSKSLSSNKPVLLVRNLEKLVKAKVRSRMLCFTETMWNTHSIPMRELSWRWNRTPSTMK